MASCRTSREPRPSGGSGDRGYFRSLRSISVADRRRALALSQRIRDLADRLGDAVRLPATEIPRHPVPAKAILRTPKPARRRSGPYGAFRPGLYPTWSVPSSATALCAPDTTPAPTRSTPSACRSPDRPVIILGDDKAKRDRERFSAAHELGHLVMHDPENAGTKIIEDQAHRFAAAFLMPASDIRGELPRIPAWSEFLTMKRRSGVSIGALLMRARTLGVMPGNTYQQAIRYMSMYGWRVNEPGNLGAGEAPQLLSPAAAARQAGVTVSTLSAETGWPAPCIADVLTASSDQRPQLSL